LRANKCGFDCVKQFRTRVNSYIHCGHDIDKIEVLVLGGTISSYPRDYVEEFCRDIYYSANTLFENR
jgi:histone acetyltransferase (RNA polymerase elongator complex component)